MICKMRKLLFLCLAAVLSVLWSFPLQGMAGERTDVIVFSTFEELRDFCAGTPDHTEASIVCEAADCIISGDMEIPAGMSLIFQSFTVPEGVTFTVSEGAEIKTYALTVKGELINRGTLFQGDLAESKEEKHPVIAANVPGHINNKGEMTLTDVYGKRNIRSLGGHFTMLETENYEKGLNTDSKEPETEPTAAPAIETGPSSEPSDDTSAPVLRFLNMLEEYLPKLAFFFVIVCLGLVVKAAFAKKKQKKSNGNSPSSLKSRRGDSSVGTDSPAEQRTGTPFDPCGEDPFLMDRKKRMTQLDDWLRNGLIDPKEYKEMKKRYEEEP